MMKDVKLEMNHSRDTARIFGFQHESPVEDKIYNYNKVTLSNLQHIKTLEEKGGGKEDIQKIQNMYDRQWKRHSETKPLLGVHVYSCRALTEYDWVSMLVWSRRASFMQKFNSKSTWVPVERDWSMWLREWFSCCLPPLPAPEYPDCSNLEVALNAKYLHVSSSDINNDDISPTTETCSSDGGDDESINV